jgi:hypothetical protein
VTTASDPAPVARAVSAALDSDPTTRVLVALRLRPLLEVAAVAERTGLAVERVEAEVTALADAGLARHRQGRVTGWMLTAEGRDRCHQQVAAELVDPQVGRVVGQAYDRFLAVNQRLIDACTAWQLRSVDGVDQPNDHLDPAHDAAVLAELAGVDDVAQPVARELGQVLARLAGYGPRLAEARRRVAEGEIDWLTAPSIDSYHTAWFEWHEDLLMTLGIERGQERPGASGSPQEAR